jgi:phage FluMu gp28-like protein
MAARKSQHSTILDKPSSSPDIEGVLLPYQRDLVRAVSQHSVTVYEKSRRIGATWGVAAPAILMAGAKREDRGMDVLYIGYNLDMAREFIDVCAMWARSLGMAAGEIGEFLFQDQEEKGVERHIAAFRIKFASGFEILALASRPRSLRGRQGFVIIDEAAFHDDLPELLKAALALLIWGGRILVVSTHDGAENPFAELVNDIRAGRKPYHLLRTSFDEACAQGLYRRVALKLGVPWTAEGEAAWKAEIRAFYGDSATEELDVVPRAGSGRYLPLHLIEARASRDIPVLRYTCADAFVHQPDHIRTAETLRWCEDNIRPLLDRLDPLLRSLAAVDFGRVADLSVIWPAQIMPNLMRKTPFTIELRNVPFEQQREILCYLLDRLPRLSGVVLDRTGNGAWLAERTMQRYGAHRVEGIHLTEGWYRDHMPKLKAVFQDASFDIPADAQVVEDFRAIELLNGVARVRQRQVTAKGEDRDPNAGQRHGDAAIAAALVIYAASRDWGSLTNFPIPRSDSMALPDDGSILGMSPHGAVTTYLG